MGDTNVPRVVAIVPAAGRSARMGAPKQLLPVQGRPMVIGVVDALRTGGADAVVLVAHSQLRDSLGGLSPDVRVAINDDATSEMIDSVRIGMNAAQDCDGYLVCPADAAGVTAADVRRCVNAFRETPERIVIASHNGRRGHPVIVPSSLAQVVNSRECDAGLNRLARNRSELIRIVECASPGTLTNVNTRDDYERLN